MTPAEIQAVQEAWMVDPESLPGDFTLPMEDCTEAEIRDALHRRILERWCAVHQDGLEFYVIRKNRSVPLVVRTRSLIGAMALAIIALAKEYPDA